MVSHSLEGVRRDILFLQMDETAVPTYPITDWLPTHPRVDQEIRRLGILIRQSAWEL
jgi:hypothetical protein